jgi:hypothetical protein
MEHLHPTGHL